MENVVGERVIVIDDQRPHRSRLFSIQVSPVVPVYAGSADRFHGVNGAAQKERPQIERLAGELNREASRLGDAESEDPTLNKVQGETVNIASQYPQPINWSFAAQIPCMIRGSAHAPSAWL
jgi:hypothetical protein